jgi:hypothetical protein
VPRGLCLVQQHRRARRARRVLPASLAVTAAFRRSQHSTPHCGLGHLHHLQLQVPRRVDGRGCGDRAGLAHHRSSCSSITPLARSSTVRQIRSFIDLCGPLWAHRVHCDGRGHA